MIKIIVLSIGVVLVVLVANSFWPFDSLRSFRVNPLEGQKVVQNFQLTPKSLLQKVKEGAGGAVKGVQTSVASYFMKKTGGEITGVLKSLPPEQQKEIQKEYCPK